MILLRIILERIGQVLEDAQKLLRAAQGWYGSDGGLVTVGAVWEVVEVECVAQCADRQSVWGKALDRQLSKNSGGGQTALSVTLSEGNFLRIRLFRILNFSGGSCVF